MPQAILFFYRIHPLNQQVHRIELENCLVLTKSAFNFQTSRNWMFLTTRNFVTTNPQQMSVVKISSRLEHACAQGITDPVKKICGRNQLNANCK